MRRRIVLYAVGAGLMALGLGGCNRDDHTDRGRLSEVLADFVYVGSATVDQRDELGRSGVQHGITAETFPDSLAVDVTYVFHRHSDTNDEDLALRVLPDRLKNSGFTLTRYPQHVRDLVTSFVGGPYFTIEFEREGRRYVLMSYRCDGDSRDLENGDGWAESDYLLVRIA